MLGQSKRFGVDFIRPWMIQAPEMNHPLKRSGFEVDLCQKIDYVFPTVGIDLKFTVSL